jgi:ABC-type phosphate transport system ATPase subunit
MDGKVIEVGDTDALFAGRTLHPETTDYIEGRFG